MLQEIEALYACVLDFFFLLINALPSENINQSLFIILFDVGFGIFAILLKENVRFLFIIFL